MSLLHSLPILSLVLWSPTAGILALLLLPSHKIQWFYRVAIIASLLPMAMSLWLYADFGKGHASASYDEVLQWSDMALHTPEGLPGKLQVSLSYALGIDGLSLPLLLLTTILGVIALMASVYVKKRQRSFMAWLLLLETGLLGLFLARDVLLFFIFLEVSVIAIFLLIGIWGGSYREKTAKLFLAVNGVGSALLLLGITALVAGAGFRLEEGDMLIGHYSSLYRDIAANLAEPGMWNKLWPNGGGEWRPASMGEATQWGIFLLLLAGFAIKSAVLPIHAWCIKLYQEAPTAVALLHCGVMLKVGVYGLLRYGLFLFPVQAAQAAGAIALLGLCQLLYGAVLAWRQTDLKSMLGYAAFSQMGMVLIGIAAFNELGLQGAVMQMLSHGLIFALLFLVAGSLQERTGTTEISSFGGLLKPMPFAGGMLQAGSLALLGLPGMSGFLGSFLSLLGAFQSYRWMAFGAVIGLALTAAYVLRGVLPVLFGGVKEELAVKRDARFTEALPMIVLLAFIIVLGCFPTVLTGTAEFSIEGFVHHIMTTRAGG
ncbi:complex I subunit 4 family protein [Paenibacillus sp. CAU 1782]